MLIGDCQVHVVSDGTFRLDGGAMFGTVPKVLWQRRAPADADNRIALGLNALLVRTPTACVLIDTGIGGKLDARDVSRFACDRSRPLETSLAGLGVGLDDIDLVIATHLHLDHAGGFTCWREGQIVPTFPRARYVVRRGEWEDAVRPHARSRASYRPDDFLPVASAGQLELIDHDGEVESGISVWRTGGHTAHHQLVRIESAGAVGLFLADLVPTTAHVDAAWVMGYDLYPVETVAAKEHWLAQAASREYVIFFEHDPVMAAGIVRGQSGRWHVEPVGP